MNMSNFCILPKYSKMFDAFCIVFASFLIHSDERTDLTTVVLKKLPKHDKSLIKELEKDKQDLCCLCFLMKCCHYTFEDPDYVFNNFYICKDCWDDNKEYSKSECWLCRKLFKVELRKLKTIKFSGRKAFFLCGTCLDIIEYVPCVQFIEFF